MLITNVARENRRTAICNNSLFHNIFASINFFRASYCDKFSGFKCFHPFFKNMYDKRSFQYWQLFSKDKRFQSNVNRIEFDFDILHATVQMASNE